MKHQRPQLLAPFLLSTLTALTGSAMLTSCSATEDDASASTNSGGNGGGGAGGGNGGEGLILGGNGGSSDSLGCSADLQYVLDENGNVVEQCSPDLGCSGGQCVPVCQAAADSQGNVGCDFSVATPHFYVGIAPPCFAVFLANNWPKDAQITISRGGQSYDVTQFGRIPNETPNEGSWSAVPATGLPPGEVAVLFLSHDPSSVNGGSSLACPVPPAISASGGSAVSGSNVGQNWEIESDVPVSAYDILPYGGADSFLPSAELLLPTTAWGTNYIAVLPATSNGFQTPGPTWGQITAATDNTTVELVPTVALPAAGVVPAAPANQVTSFTLNAGEYVQWQLGSNTDMTGTVISSDSPVAFTGGDAYICYSSATSSGGGCDSAHQQIPPVSALASDYVAPPYTTRGTAPESIRYRFVGAVDGTSLAYDPAIPGAPTAIDQGQAIEFETIEPFRVRSQDEEHPFYVGQVMSGNGVAGNAFGEGDEEFVNILPPAQWLSKYVFFTDPSYPTTNLVFVRRATANGFQPVTLACSGELTGWVDVGSEGEFQMTNIDVVRQGVNNGACVNGAHVAESEGPFGLMVWGLDNFSSYAYPAGGSVAPINTVIVPPTPK